MFNVSRTPIAATLAFAAAGSAGVLAATLKPEAIAGWTTYVAATERRMAAELGSPSGFLASSFVSTAAADRAAARGGRIVVHDVETRDERGQVLRAPAALIHHWRGMVLIPGQTVDDVLAWVASGKADTGQEDIVRSSVLERDAEGLTMFLRLKRTKIVTAVYNTEHRVTIRRLGPGRAASTSIATKIAEVANPDTPSEHELPAGEDRGFLWRLNAYWRYEQVDGGVLAECESLTLSRDLPPIIGVMLKPIVGSTARESMERTLSALRDRLRN